MTADASPAERLKDMGFRKCADWMLENGAPKCCFFDGDSASNVLYAFICNGEVLYIGKTVRSLKERMYNYQKPGTSQRTSMRGNKAITESLSLGKQIEVHALPDNGLLYYGGFHVNLAAGLEDSLISQLKPVWNIAGI